MARIEQAGIAALRAEVNRLRDMVRGHEQMHWLEEAHRPQQQRNAPRAVLDMGALADEWERRGNSMLDEEAADPQNASAAVVAIGGTEIKCAVALRAVLARSQAPQAPAEQECSDTCAPHLHQHCSPECERECAGCTLAPAEQGAPHTRTEYDTLNCPVQGVRAYDDDGKCSGCGAVTPAPPVRPATD